MQKHVKLAVGAAGGLVVAIGVVVITASAAGIHLTGAPTSAATNPSPAPSPSPTARAGQANPTARLVNQAALQAEAQVLGMQPRDLTKNLRQGTSVHQLATQKGIAQADFQTRFEAALKPLLDQAVQQGQLTSQQEQQALKRLAARVPNWDQARRPQASPSPTPTA